MIKPRAKRAISIHTQKAELLREVEKSKQSYSSFVTPEDALYEHKVNAEHHGGVEAALATIPDPVISTIARVYTFDHIPLTPDRKTSGRELHPDHARVNFAPFIHYRLTDTGWIIVGKSHWVGGMDNGHFSVEHGRLTNRLGEMIMTLISKYSNKSSWSGYSFVDEMRSAALVHMMEAALKFNEMTGDNVFAYYTSCVANCFIKTLNSEKEQYGIRDDMLVRCGAKPSQAAQDAEYYKKFALPPLERKRGRPKAA